MSAPPIRVLDQAATRALVGPADAIAACREALTRVARGEVEQPDVLGMAIPESRGEVHAKGAFLHQSPYFSIKVATGFYDNPALGLPVTSGAVWVFSASTGRLAMMILDGGFLTELRTGAAGAIAADVLARDPIRTVGLIGAGSQARYQIEALLEVRDPDQILVWNRNPSRATEFALEMGPRLGRSVAVAPTPRALVEGADLVITTTPATEPILLADWVKAGTHVTAIGSDLPQKRELEPGLVGRAKVVVDRLSQCLTQGELHHAVESGLMTPERVHAELAEVVAGLKPGRESDDEITVADLTGMGALDAAMANLVAQRAEVAGVGAWLDLDG
jgi:ornithine cyclodeaminase/alanine dehydrogenase-like protein (mu-crystallin family)